MRFKIILHIAFLFSAMEVNGQNFFRSYGNSDDEVAKSVVETKDSSFFIFGSSSSYLNGSSNFYLLKIDSLGTFQWSKTYGGSEVEQGYSIVMKPNGHYLMTGFSNGFGNGYDIWNVEIDSLGNQIWEKNLGGADWDFAYGSTAMPNGDVLITGSTYSFGNGNQDGYLWLIDNNGDSVWMKTMGGTEEDILRQTILTTTGELVSVGSMTNSNGDKDFYLVKTQLDGDTIWTKHYGTSANDEGYSLTEAKNGKYVLAGYTEGIGNGGKEGYYFEVDTSGTMGWFQTYGGTGNEIFNAIISKPNESRFYTAWESQSVGNGGYEFVVNSLYQSGGWNNVVQSYGTLMNEKPYDILYTSQKKVMTVGSTDSPYGNLNVMVVFSDTLMPSQATMTNYVDVTSIHEENENAEMKIFPNPASDKLNVFSEKEISTISIYDLNGKMVLVFESNTLDLDISALTPSVYLMKTEFKDGKLANHRLLVTKR